jgi:hypothetical protein
MAKSPQSQRYTIHDQLKRVNTVKQVNGEIKYSKPERLGHELMNLANALGRNAGRTGSDLKTLQKEALADSFRPSHSRARGLQDHSPLVQDLRLTIFLGTFRRLLHHQDDSYGQHRLLWSLLQ